MNGDKEASGDEDEEEAIFYDKAKSFFDNISCDATEQARGYSISLLSFRDADNFHVRFAKLQSCFGVIDSWKHVFVMASFNLSVNHH